MAPAAPQANGHMLASLIVLGSALDQHHLAVGDGVAAWIWAVGTFVLEAFSHFAP